MSSAPAGADGGGQAVTDGDGIDFGAITGGSHGGSNSSSSGSGSGSGPVCTYRLLGGPENFPVFDIDGNPIEVEPGGAWYEKTCDGIFYGGVYLNGPPEAVDPGAVAAGVLERMAIPAPQVAMNPTGDHVVNLASWLWIPNWASLSGTASVGPVTVRVTVRPTSATWRFGDGTISTCAPGVAWAPGANRSAACTHTWKRSSTGQPSGRFAVSVSVTWTASYTVTGGVGGGTLDSITRTTTILVRVGEVQALNESRGG